MITPTRGSTASQTLQLYLYRRPLHPEHFPLKGRKTITHGGYELEAWIMPGCHVLRFRHKDFMLSELLIDHEDNLPLEGAITGFPCSGEHEFEKQFLPEKVGYCTAVQTETLSDNLYRATYEDMVDYAKQTDSLAYKYLDGENRKCLSILDLQHLSKEVHCQGFHLLAGTGLVVRTQTIFDHK
jgi:hypothetical protein